jgi:tRNA threonylcarbamoyladenosine biosynthesis protein TsaE
VEITFNLNEIHNVAEQIATIAKQHNIITLHGEMAAGKTTLVTAICQALGYQGKAGSPTFSLINEFVLPDNEVIYHIDLYRIKNLQEAIDAGIEDAIYSGNICFIEWPSITPELIPTEAIAIELIKLNENARQLRINL